MQQPQGALWRSAAVSFSGGAGRAGASVLGRSGAGALAIEGGACHPQALAGARHPDVLPQGLRRHPSGLVAARHWSRVDPQQQGDFFLDLDDGLGLDQALAQPLVLSLQLDDPLPLGIDWLGLTAALNAAPAPARAHRSRAGVARWSDARNTGPRGAAGRRSPRACSGPPVSKTSNLYLAVKRRRVAFSTTSGSGAVPASAPALEEDIPVALRAPSVSSSSAEFLICFTFATIGDLLPALQ